MSDPIRERQRAREARWQWETRRAVVWPDFDARAFRQLQYQQEQHRAARRPGGGINPTSPTAGTDGEA